MAEILSAVNPMSLKAPLFKAVFSTLGTILYDVNKGVILDSTDNPLAF